MDNQPPASLKIDVAEYTPTEAYAYLGIKDTTIPDGDVVVAYWSSQTHHKDKALEVIARRRESPWLAFILTILPHLTHNNVALLATPPSSPDAADLPSDVKIEELGSPSNLNPVNISQSDAQHPTPSSSAARDTSDDDVTMTPAGSDYDLTIPPEDNSASSEQTTSTGIPLSEEDSADSDFDEPIGGRYWNGKSWRCEECNDELVNGRCPNGDLINPCKNCGRDFQSGRCSRYCGECHDGLLEQCSACAGEDHSEQGTNDQAKMVWDDEDGVWRCTVCLWEVEANSRRQGQCHCQVELKPIAHYPRRTTIWDCPRPRPSARRIKLLYYHEYEPADSDSSGPESVDSEPDSEDEAFIEDDGPFDPALLTLEGPLYPPDDLGVTETSDILGNEVGPESMDTA